MSSSRVGEPIPGQGVKVLNVCSRGAGHGEVPGALVVAVLWAEPAEADHVGDGQVVFRLEPALLGERLAGLGHVGRPCASCR